MLKRKIEINRTSPQNTLLAVVMCDEIFVIDGFPEFDFCLIRSFSGGAKLIMMITTKRNKVIEYEIIMTGFKSTKEMTLRAVTEVNKLCQSLKIPNVYFNYLFNKSFPIAETEAITVLVEKYDELIQSFKLVDKLSNNKKYYLLYFSAFNKTLYIKLGKKSAIYHVIKMYYKLFKNERNKE